MANYMYIRVSDKSQNESRQLNDLNELNVPEENVFIDKQSGKDFNRPEYQRMLEQLQEGDLVYFHSIDRMGRNYDDILENWRIITKEIKADIIVLDMPLLNTTIRNDDLTGRFMADMVLQILSYVAQREREAIKIRQMEGIRIAQAKGAFKKKDIDMDLFFECEKKIAAGELTVVAACKKLNITRKYYYILREKNKGNYPE